MYQYKYIPVDTGGGFLSDTRNTRSLSTHTPQKAGGMWDFFPVSFTSHGGISQVDLIFERSRKLPT